MDKLLTLQWKESYDSAFTGARYLNVSSTGGSGFIITSSDPAGNPFNYTSYVDGDILDIGPIVPTSTFYLICKQRTDDYPIIKSLVCSFTPPLVLDVTWEENYPEDYLGNRFLNVTVLNGRGFTIESLDSINNPFSYNSNLNTGEEKHIGPIIPTSVFNLIVKNKEGSVARVIQCPYPECILEVNWNTEIQRSSDFDYYFDVSCENGSGWDAIGGGFTFSGEDGITTGVGPLTATESFTLKIKSRRGNKEKTLQYNPFLNSRIRASWEFPEDYTPSYLGPRYFNVNCENSTGWVAKGGGLTFSGTTGITKHCGPINPINSFYLEFSTLQGNAIDVLHCNYDMGPPLYVIFYPPYSTTQNEAWNTIFFNCKHDFGTFDEIPLNRTSNYVPIQGPFLTKNDYFNASVELKDYNLETTSNITFDVLKIQTKGGYTTTPNLTKKTIDNEITDVRNKKEEFVTKLSEDRITSFSLPTISLSSESINVVIISATIQTKSSDTEPTPIAQSFFVNNILFPSGLYLSGVDLFFKTKSQTYPISIEIRESINGYPHSTECLPFSKVYVEAKDIATSNDSTVPTHFEFETPIYLPPGEFHLCIKSATTDYTAYIATIGNYLLGSATERVTKQSSVGSLFKSANSSTWIPVQEADLKFILYRCKFNTDVEHSEAELINSSSITREIPFETVTLNGKTVLPPGTTLDLNKFTLVNYETSFKQFFNKTLELQNEFKIGSI